MADAVTIRASAERAVKTLVPTPSMVTPLDYPVVPPYDRATTFLVLRKEDILEGASHQDALRALRAHLG